MQSKPGWDSRCPTRDGEPSPRAGAFPVLSTRPRGQGWISSGPPRLLGSSAGISLRLRRTTCSPSPGTPRPARPPRHRSSDPGSLSRPLPPRDRRRDHVQAHLSILTSGAGDSRSRGGGVEWPRHHRGIKTTKQENKVSGGVQIPSLLFQFFKQLRSFILTRTAC